MRKLLINSTRQPNPGQFTLWAKGTTKPIITEIGDYLEVVLQKKLGKIGEMKTPNKPQEIRGYEFTIWHSAIHSAKTAELVRFDCPAITVDMLLKRQLEGEILRLRPVLVEHVTRDHAWKWYILAVDGEYIWNKKSYQVPHSSFEYLYGKDD